MVDWNRRWPKQPKEPPVKPVQQYLYEGGGGPITVQALAEKIGSTVEHVQRLIQYKYLRVVMEKTDPLQTVVSAPNEKGIEWLRMMATPIHQIPLVRLEDVHKMLRPYQGQLRGNVLRNAAYKVRQVCLSFNIPIYLDPIYGELITIEGLDKLVHCMRIYRCPVRYDRATMLGFLLNAMPKPSSWGDRKNPLKVPRYTQRLSLEIHRIMQLEQPERTIQAIALYEAWADARGVQECLTNFKYQGSRTAKRIKRMDKEMERMRNQVLSIKPNDASDETSDA
jgi:hypothetical protein